MTTLPINDLACQMNTTCITIEELNGHFNSSIMYIHIIKYIIK